ncbi:MAG: hypothetical protein JSS83_10240 [Cyanobacteria bacterium SZAS LIN-3]|nr:hypothetical protein [Cyanobacteria bacterium SZAS LIN-3]MBS2009234.1 hypothetical protein [Cyanobacteria bacterium SZAS TMP-1]
MFHSQKEVSENTLTQETLNFGIDRLVAFLKSGKPPLRVSAVKVSPYNFVIQMEGGVTLVGCHNKIAQKVVDVSVFGKGPVFKVCVDRVSRLASSNNQGLADLFAMPDAIGAPSGQFHEEFAERDGTRYHLQKFDNIFSFHCCNARSDDRAIHKAQPLP